MPGQSRASPSGYLVDVVAPTTRSLGNIVGVIRHRLLVNRLADPAEVASRLPSGVRPHVTASGGVIVGCCLIRIDSTRPWPVPKMFGSTLRAAAHRISVETGSEDSPTRAVYVPCRHTDSALPVMVGGRIFPGVHQRAEIDVAQTDRSLAWSVRGRGPTPVDGGIDRFDIAVEADVTTETKATSDIAEIVVGTVLGLSPKRSHGSLEGADMCLADLSAQRVELRTIESDFLDSFETAVPAESFLMTDVDVTWRRS